MSSKQTSRLLPPVRLGVEEGSPSDSGASMDGGLMQAMTEEGKPSTTGASTDEGPPHIVLADDSLSPVTTKFGPPALLPLGRGRAGANQRFHP